MGLTLYLIFENNTGNTTNTILLVFYCIIDIILLSNILYYFKIDWSLPKTQLIIFIIFSLFSAIYNLRIFTGFFNFSTIVYVFFADQLLLFLTSSLYLLFFHYSEIFGNIVIFNKLNRKYNVFKSQQNQNKKLKTKIELADLPLNAIVVNVSGDKQNNNINGEIDNNYLQAMGPYEFNNYEDLVEKTNFIVVINNLNIVGVYEFKKNLKAIKISLDNVESIFEMFPNLPHVKDKYINKYLLNIKRHNLINNVTFKNFKNRKINFGKKFNNKNWFYH